ncbi:cytochrome P450 [Streptomyces sp. RKAG293]|uniref:cytochrome P450 n=1 Tax=Streptomyces sp. RKAG293 TaxID=2893403 RepID=UPI002033D555|nr:cytochrome P450 [Streptomyces sp. RKAG293]MCM2422692.1 cytochrome P450 [Streptomyces sp. RKAG293]
MDTATAPSAAPPAPRGVIRRLQSRQGREDPFPLFEEIRSAGPVVSHGPHALLVTGYTECLQILTDRIWQVPDHKWRAARGLDTDGLSAKVLITLPRLNPPLHGRMRRLQSGPFTPAALERIRPTVRTLVRIHLDQLDAELTRYGQADFVGKVARALPVAVMCEILGLPSEDRALVARYSLDTAALTEPFATPAQTVVADAAAAEFHTYVMALLDERARTPGTDLMSQWLTHERLGTERVPRDELAAHIVFLVGAGAETTSSLFATAVQAFEQYPGQARWLAAHSEALPQAIEELTRWDPSVQNAVRVPTRETTVAGTHVPAGTLVHALIAAANRDPAHFPDPHTLDFRRPPRRSLAFGAGIHYCLGAPLARLNAAEFLPELLRRFPTLHTDGPATRTPGLNLRTFLTLPVSRRPRPVLTH